MKTFCWISAEILPDNLDLRQCGWTLVDPLHVHDGCITLIHANDIDQTGWSHLLDTTGMESRRLMLVGGVNAPECRAKFLSEGFGDAVGDRTCMVELDARAQRLSTQRSWLPRRREIATLELDLVNREANYAGSSLGLNPREFAILWRLSDHPGETVSKRRLLHDVWRQDTAANSNSIAVHLSRLRSKLALVELADLVATSRDGYRLCLPPADQPSTKVWLELLRSREQGGSLSEPVAA